MLLVSFISSKSTQVRIHSVLFVWNVHSIEMLCKWYSSVYSFISRSTKLWNYKFNVEKEKLLLLFHWNSITNVNYKSIKLQRCPNSTILLQSSKVFLVRANCCLPLSHSSHLGFPLIVSVFITWLHENNKRSMISNYNWAST